MNTPLKEILEELGLRLQKEKSVPAADAAAMIMTRCGLHDPLWIAELVARSIGLDVNVKNEILAEIRKARDDFKQWEVELSSGSKEGGTGQAKTPPQSGDLG